MPIVLPTEERVAAMLRATSQPPDKVVGRMRAGNFRESWEYTVEKVAVNAVMAGARPEYFPVILALAASNQTSRQGSTTSQTCFSVVNGPIRNELGMNAGIGAMGPYNHANTAIGRAYSLLSQNGQGGSVPGETYMGALGNPWPTACAFPRTRSAAHGYRCTSKRDSNQRTARSAFSSAIAESRRASGRATPGKQNSAAASPPRRTSHLALLSIRSSRACSPRAASIEGRSDRLVRAERPRHRARLLGRSVDSDAGPAARGRRRRAIRDTA